ncbi:TolC family protein [Chitinophaga silvatica]|uniref:TolC family protein n=1 Tax=Chitinophaga silvatica TaxID=2282649 RepID=A0A3E1YG86_9BACT|nr:TolC family protein [Chitinophaga silvatica]RFS26411.1 TolC family protein [Chitinophaga silvatica]
MYTSIKKGALLISPMLLFFLQTFAQQNILDEYIQVAFHNNKGLKSQQFELTRSMLALQEARSLFGPNVAVLGSYTKSKGGRTIDFPIGDLMNPVYSSLNQLTNSHQFPTLSNVSFQLNPENFYDAKVRASLPLINAEIYYNQKIKQQQISQQQAALNVYKRELVKDIKSAYFQYYQAFQSVDIYRNAMLLINENIRINESMVKNGVRNNTAVYRARTEQEKIISDINQAENNRRNAQAYFNFLLNRDLESDITLDSTLLGIRVALPAKDINGREELQQYKSATTAYQLNEKMQRSYLIPKLNTFVDLGSQGAMAHFNQDTRYYLIGVNLEWNIFSSNKQKYRIQQASNQVHEIVNETAKTQDALELQLYQTTQNYQTALANMQAAKSQLAFSEKYYRDQLKVYKEGQLLYLELLDAQNQLTQAQLKNTIALAAVQTAYAAVERAVAGYDINDHQQ